MTNPDYYKATNLAYRVLVSKNNISLPIDIFQIAQSYTSLKIVSYSEMAKRFKISFIEFLNYAPSQYGFIMKKSLKSSRAYIVFNDKKDLETIKFTIAHELGHYIMEHNSESALENKEANCFARNILCPVPIANDLGLVSINDYKSVFCISEPMANVCVDKKETDFYYITKTLYSRIKDLFFIYMNGYTEEYLYGVY